MNIQIFTLNNAGKIELSREEFENLLNKTYEDGYKQGRLDSEIRIRNSSHSHSNHGACSCGGNCASHSAKNEKPENTEKTRTVSISKEIDPKFLEAFLPIARSYPNEAIANLAKELGL